MSESQSHEAQVEALAEQFLEQLQAGQQPDKQALLDAHPDIAEALAHRLALVDVMFRAAQTHEEASAPVTGERALRIQCPHCGNRIQIVEPQPQEITCTSCGSSFHLDPQDTVSHHPAQLPKAIGKFEVHELLGRGSFGSVYRCFDPELQRTVAVKVPRAGYFESPEEKERFLREARSAARLQHSGIVPVHEVGHQQGMPYIVSDFVEGLTLADLLTGGRPTFRESAEIVAQLADALDYAHQARIIHRDIKPSNILVQVLEPNHSLFPRITDFGLARRDEGEITVTIDGQILGTPAYMPPEQAAGESHQVDARSDIYSLGVVLYELLTGERPFRGNKRMVLHQVVHDEPRPPRRINDTIPRDLETICLKAMAKEPRRRYASARELADDLRRYLRGEPILARPVGKTERFWRWCRRKPVVAGLTAVVGALLIVVCGLSLWAAIYYARTSHDLTEARDQAKGEATRATDAAGKLQIALTNEEKERKNAETARQNEKTERERKAEIADQSQARLGRHYVDNGLRLLKDDPWGAGLWFAEALKWDGEHPVRSTIHRQRLSAFLQSQPRLVHVWPTDEYRIAVSPDGRRLVTSRILGDQQDPAESETRLYDVWTGKLLAPPLKHRGGIPRHVWRGRHTPLGHHVYQDVFFSADGCRTVAIRPVRGEVQVWDVGEGKPITPVLQHEGVAAADFTADGRTLLTRSKYEIRLWDAASGKSIGKPIATTTFQMSPDGRRLLTPGVEEDERRQLWDTATGELVARLEGNLPSGRVQFSSDGRLLTAFTPEKSGTGPAEKINPQNTLELRTWDTATGKPLRDPVMVKCPRAGGGILDNPMLGNQRAFAFSSEGEARVWDLQTGQSVSLALTEKPTQVIGKFSPEGRRLLTIITTETSLKVIQVWNTETGKPAGPSIKEAVPQRFLQSPDLSPDGRRLSLVTSAEAFGRGDYKYMVQLWDVESGKELMPALNYREGKVSTSFSPDSRRMLVVRTDFGVNNIEGEVLPIDTLTGAPVGPALKQNQPIAHFNADGRHLFLHPIFGAGIEVWDLEPGPLGGSLVKLDPSVKDVWRSPDEQRLLTRRTDGTLRWWDLATGQLGPVLGKLPGDVRRVWFSPDGRQTLLLAVESGNTAWLFDAQAERTVLGPLRPYEVITNSWLSDNGKRLLLVGGKRLPGNTPSMTARDPEARVWDVASGEPVTPPLRDAEGTVLQTVLSWRGDHAYLLRGDHSVEDWYLLGPSLINTLAPPGEVAALRMSADGQFLIMIGRDGTVRRHPVDSSPGPKLPEAMADVLKDPHALVNVCQGSLPAVLTVRGDTVQLIDAANGKPVSPPLKHPGKVRHASGPHPAGTVVTATEDGTVRLWSTNLGKEIGALMRPEGGVERLHYYPSGNRLLTAGRDGQVRLWDQKSGEELAVMEHPGEITHLILFSTREGPNASRFGPDRLLTASKDGVARIWEFPSGKSVGGPLKHDGELVHLEIQGNGQHLAGVTRDGTVRVWSTTTGKPTGDPLKHEGPVHYAHFLTVSTFPNQPEANLLFTACEDGTVRTWNYVSGREFRPPLKHSAPVTRLATERQKLITGCKDGTVRVWDAMAQKEQFPALEHKGEITHLIWQFVPGGGSPARGYWIMAATREGVVRIWDVETGKPITPPMEHSFEPVHLSLLSLPARHLVVAGKDGSHRIWSLPSGRPMGETVRIEGVIDHGSHMVRRALALSKGEVGIWDLGSGERLGRLEHPGKVRSLATPAVPSSFPTSSLFTLGEDGKVRVWDGLRGTLASVVQVDPEVLQVSLSNHRSRLLLTCKDNTVRLWDAGVEKEIGLPMKHEAEVTAALLVDSNVSSQAERRVLTVSGRQARLWDSATGEPIGPALDHKTPLLRAHLLPASPPYNSDPVVLTIGETDAQLWNARTGKLQSGPVAHPRIESASFGFAGGSITPGLRVAMPDGVIVTWSVLPGQLSPTSQNLKEARLTATMSPDGERVLTTTGGGVACLYEVAPGGRAEPLLREMNCHAYFVENGSLVRVQVRGKNEFHHYDSRTGQLVPAPEEKRGEEPFGPPVKGDNGRRLVRVSKERDRFRIFDAADPEAVLVEGQLPKSRWINEVVLSPDGERLLTLNRSSSDSRPPDEIQLWDASTAKPIGPAIVLRMGFGGDFNTHPKAQFSSDSRRFLTLDKDGQVRVWEAATGQPLTPALQPGGMFQPKGAFVEGPRADQFEKAQFLPDGHRVLTMSKAGQVRVWDATTGQPITPPANLGDELVLQSVSPDGNHLLFRAGGALWTWDLKAGTERPEALIALAQYLSRRRLDSSGSFSPLPTGGTGAVKDVPALLANLPRSDATESMRAWHEDQAAAAEKGKDWGTQERHLSQLIALAPDGQRALLYRRRAAALQQLGRLDDAAADLTRLIDSAEDGAQVRHDRGVIRYRQGQWEKALADFQKAVELSAGPTVHPGGLLGLAQTWCRLGQPEKALTVLEKRPATNPNLKRLQATLRLYLNDRQSYQQVCKEALAELPPDANVFAMNSVAWACALSPDAVEDWARPLMLGEKVAAYVRNNPDLANTHGAILYRAGQHDKAIEVLQKGIELRRDRPVPVDWLFLAMAHQRKGNDKEAQEALAKAVEWMESVENKQTTIAAMPASVPVIAWLELQILRKEAETLLKR